MMGPSYLESPARVQRLGAIDFKPWKSDSVGLEGFFIKFHLIPFVEQFIKS